MPPATDLARRYGDALAALRAIHAFDAWLGRHWHERCAAPVSEPVSLTPLGVSGSITWYERDDVVVGVLPGQEGCFRVPRDAPMPEFPLAAGGPPLPREQDVVISASMRAEVDLPGS
jgi:hypothetical protein